MATYFLTYSREAEDEAAQVNDALISAGMRSARDENASVSDALRAADFMFAVFTDSAQLEEIEVRKEWEFFDGEIRWGRKKSGEIILMPSDESAIESVPLRLKKYGYYLVSEAEDAAEYCLSAIDDEEEEEAGGSEGKMPPVKPIVYTPPEDMVKQIEFSVRAPSVPSFDGTVKIKREDKENVACRDDHYFDDELESALKRKKKKSAGAVGLGFLIAFLLAVAIVGIVVFVVKYSDGINALVLMQRFARVFSPRSAQCGGSALAPNALQALAGCGII